MIPKSDGGIGGIIAPVTVTTGVPGGGVCRIPAMVLIATLTDVIQADMDTSAEVVSVSLATPRAASRS